MKNQNEILTRPQVMGKHPMEKEQPVYKNLMPQNSFYKQEMIDKIWFLSFTYGFIIKVK